MEMSKKAEDLVRSFIDALVMFGRKPFEDTHQPAEDASRKLEDYIMELETENSMLKNKTDDIASIKSMVESIYNEHHFFDNTAYPEVYFKETTRDEN